MRPHTVESPMSNVSLKYYVRFYLNNALKPPATVSLRDCFRLLTMLKQVQSVAQHSERKNKSHTLQHCQDYVFYWLGSIRDYDQCYYETS